ncbi:MAG: Fis family transcriptional regulator [Sulfurospirillum sp.]|nr:MAG: Fis family transcriptional regulator [Sulfurospirillum sp.]
MIKFIAKSTQLTNLVKSLQLTKKFFVSSLIVGEAYSGKKTVARYILPDAPVVNGEDLQVVLDALQTNDELIIYNFTQISNYALLNFDNKRIIATARYQPKDKSVDELFGYIYNLPPLYKRLEDAKALAEVVVGRAKEVLGIEDDITVPFDEIDLRKNSKSLEKSIYKNLILKDMDETDIEKLMYRFFLEHLHGNNDYKKYLHLYERPLIKAGLYRYKSQLKLAGVLGINRNTLRKKANEYDL